jgi:SPP1 family predicted phage head-tail adaptor
MRSGPLRHRISIQEPVITRTSSGAERVEFVSIGTVWASVEPLRGSETLRSNQVTAEMDTRIRIRWSRAVDEITAKWRIEFHGVIYNIKQVAHLGFKHREIEIMASSGVNRG